MASSYSSFRPSKPVSSSRLCEYDVFLSFRGEDTRKTFVDHLYSSLEQHLIHVYKDDETLPRGESIDKSLLNSIEESRIAVIIFSKHYADSAWCLEELTHIMKCKAERELSVIPIFYDVEPTEVRNQKRKFGEAFAKQKANNINIAEMWRKALVDVSNIAGWELKNIFDGHESQFIKKVVDTILDRLFALNLCVNEDLVGMRDRFQDVQSLLDIDSPGVRIVGIWGVGGGGKTTLATSLYMKIFQHFQGHCIVENVREETGKHGLNKLQENILSALFKKEVKVHSVAEGKHMMKSMLCRRKVLVVLDDVNKLDQLEALAGKHNWFGSRSRIIITTRDKHLLETHKVNHIYPITLLSHDEAIQLFKRHAYNEEEPIEDYDTLSLHVVSYACGLPLSLKVLGSFLYDKNKNEWISALKRLKDIPNSEVMNILKISYDGLEPYEKEIFLDIACFWRRNSSCDAMEILEACGFHPEIGIKVLSQKALITIIDNEYGVTFDMHDLVQEMGNYMVRREHPPEKHSRVWSHKEITEICYKDAIMENETIEAIRFKESSPHYSLPLGKLVSNMKKLRWLVASSDGQEVPTYLSNELRYIHLYYYPASFFRGAFLPKKLVVLKLYKSMQKELWKDNQHLPNLKVLELVKMKMLLKTPNFDELPCLQKLILRDCCTLKEIHPSLGHHTSLEYLYVSDCIRLKKLPAISQMKNIRTLLIMWCSLEDAEIPYGIGDLSYLQELNLCGNDFSRLDFSLSQLTQLKCLNLSYCDNLLELPELPSSLVVLTTYLCSSLTVIEDFNKKCKHLCQVSFIDGWGDKLLRSMLQGKTIENGSMHLYLEGCEIPKGFTPPLLRGGSCRLKLPDNWWYDFTGFLMCFVVPDVSPIQFGTRITVKQLRGDVYFEDDVVWEESDGDSDYDMTWVWYVSFGSLRHTTWWDQTYKALEFNIERYHHTRCSGFRVKLVDTKSRIGLETSTISSSHYNPKFKIQHDSVYALTASLSPYDSFHFDFDE